MWTKWIQIQITIKSSDIKDENVFNGRPAKSHDQIYSEISKSCWHQLCYFKSWNYITTSHWGQMHINKRCPGHDQHDKTQRFIVHITGLIAQIAHIYTLPGSHFSVCCYHEHESHLHYYHDHQHSSKWHISANVVAFKIGHYSILFIAELIKMWQNPWEE